MEQIKNILRFGWPYLRRYWGRLLAGILLGVLFGISNASFIWATKTIFERLEPKNLELVVSTNTTLQIVVSTNKFPVLSTNFPQQLQIGTNAELRLTMSETVVSKSNAPLSLTKKVTQSVKGSVAKLKQAANRFVDPWLPAMGREADWKQILGGLLFFPFFVAIRGYVGYLSSYCMAWVSERVVRDIRLDLIKKLNSLSLDFFNRSTAGELLARVNSDTGALYRCMSLSFSDLIKEPITIIAVLIGLFAVDWQLTLMAIFFVPLTIIPTRILGKKARRSVVSNLDATISQDSLLVENYSSIRVVKAFCMEKMQFKRLEKIYNDIVRIGMKSVQARELINPSIETISMLGLGMVILFIFYFEVETPDLVGFMTGVIILFQPLKKLGGIHVSLQQASVGATRLIDIFNTQPTVKEKPDATPLPKFEKALTFENVSFAYSEKLVLKNLNLTIPKGLKLGVAGESGSGKSSLVNLILRFYDSTHGAVKIDGHDLRDISVFDLRQQMALVSQEVVVFDQTIAENIACGREGGATREEIEAAAKAAFAHDFIMQLPHGYDTRTGERGVSLSGGQRQRIAIARAFVRNAPILILDEATAALDSQSEAVVQAAIDRLTENRTVICIAHRLSTLARTDSVIVLSNGEIIEEGRFDDLLKKNGAFAGMAARQGIFANRPQT